MEEENIIPTPVEETKENSSPTRNNLLMYVVIGLIVCVGVYFMFTNNKNKMVNTPVPTATQSTVAEIKQISLSEIAAHKTKEDCWTAINGGVYDVTSFISKHKGGDKILSGCGIDATDLFTGKSPLGRVHSQIAVKLLEGMKIGSLKN